MHSISEGVGGGPGGGGVDEQGDEDGTGESARLCENVIGRMRGSSC